MALSCKSLFHKKDRSQQVHVAGQPPVLHGRFLSHPECVFYINIVRREMKMSAILDFTTKLSTEMDYLCLKTEPWFMNIPKIISQLVNKVLEVHLTPHPTPLITAILNFRTFYHQIEYGIGFLMSENLKKHVSFRFLSCLTRKIHTLTYLPPPRRPSWISPFWGLSGHFSAWHTADTNVWIQHPSKPPKSLYANICTKCLHHFKYALFSEILPSL